MAGSGVLEAAITEKRDNVVRYLLSDSDAYAAHGTNGPLSSISTLADVEQRVSRSKS